MADLSDRFAKRLEQEMKNIMACGLSTSSPLWKYAKANAVRAIGKEFKVEVSFNEEGWSNAMNK
jgi:hypothetical protein